MSEPTREQIESALRWEPLSEGEQILQECVATLKSQRDSLERIVRVLVEGASIEHDSIDINCDFVWAANMTPGDFDYLRSLITPTTEGEK